MSDLRQRLMGMPLDAVTLDGAMERIETDLHAGRGGAVLTPNLDILRQFRQSSSIRNAMEGVELLVADGVPLVWASKVQGTPVPARITGTDMLWAVTAVAARQRLNLFIAGGRQDQGSRAAQRLRELHAGLQVGTHPCFVRPSDLERQLRALAQVLEDAAPSVVLIALPFTAQVGLIGLTRSRLPRTWFIGIGSSCDFVNGDRPRAPRWLQQAGLEWAHRVAHEPRMARRYLVDGLPFAAQLGVHVLRARFRRTTRRSRSHDLNGAG
jgi:N-acetylglucosaminyldiphosphoundecaprenol N-acetyl-beta-D-mannosaminyltransferase